MSDRSVELRVGLTVLLASIVFFAGIIFLSEAFVGAGEMTLSVVFDNAGGLQVGDPVRVSGVKKGKVGGIELGDRHVILELEIESDARIYTDAAFRVESFGLMGEMNVAIDPGSGGQLIDPDAKLQGSYSAGLGAALEETGPLLTQLRSVVEKVDLLLDRERMIDPLTETVENLSAVSADLKGVLNESRDDIEGSAVERPIRRGRNRQGHPNERGESRHVDHGPRLHVGPTGISRCPARQIGGSARGNPRGNPRRRGNHGKDGERRPTLR